MFDANAAHIPVGKKFFAQVDSVNPQLCKLGIVKGDIILCEHTTKVKDGKWSKKITHTKIWTKQDKEKGHYDYDDSVTEFPFGWLKYSGCPDGTGFICDKWKQKALDFLGGEWYAK
jgi:hypothetical protein